MEIDGKYEQRASSALEGSQHRPRKKMTVTRGGGESGGLGSGGSMGGASVGNLAATQRGGISAPFGQATPAAAPPLQQAQPMPEAQAPMMEDELGGGELS